MLVDGPGVVGSSWVGQGQALARESGWGEAI
jgi:hypothetical protein